MLSLLPQAGEQQCLQPSGDGARIPRFLIAHHGIEGSQKFSHGRSERDCERLAGVQPSFRSQIFSLCRRLEQQHTGVVDQYINLAGSVRNFVC